MSYSVIPSKLKCFKKLLFSLLFLEHERQESRDSFNTFEERFLRWKGGKRRLVKPAYDRLNYIVINVNKGTEEAPCWEWSVSFARGGVGSGGWFVEDSEPLYEPRRRYNALGHSRAYPEKGIPLG